MAILCIQPLILSVLSVFLLGGVLQNWVLLDLALILLNPGRGLLLGISLSHLGIDLSGAVGSD
jgi:hypothetical protein